MVDICNAVLLGTMAAAYLVIHMLKDGRARRAVGGAMALIAITGVANWFWPHRLYVPDRVGGPLSDTLTLVAYLIFMILGARDARGTKAAARDS